MESGEMRILKLWNSEDRPFSWIQFVRSLNLCLHKETILSTKPSRSFLLIGAM